MKNIVTILTLSLLMVSNIRAAMPHPYERFNNLGGKTQKLCVRSITQTPDGMMWLGAEEGLYTYDGHHLHERKNSNDHHFRSMHGSITCLAPQGDNLIVGYEQSVYLLHLSNDAFRSLRLPPHETVRGTLIAHGHRWIGTDHAIYCDGTPMSINIKEILSIWNDNTYLYIGTRSAFYQYSFRGRQIEKMMDAQIVTCFANATASDQLWIGTATSIVLWDKKKGEALFTHSVPVAKCMCMDRHGNLLVGTDNGLYIVDHDRQVHQVHHDARTSESLAGDVVWSLFRDKDDNIWAGTNSGVSMVPESDRLTTYTLPSITGESIGNQIFCIHCDSKGRLWLGGSNGLICVQHLGEENQTFRWYRMDNPNYPLQHNRIRILFQDSHGHLWVGGDGGLLLMREETGQFERYEIVEEEANWIYDIEETTGGPLSVTTLNATYIVQPDMSTRTLRTQRQLPRGDIDARQKKMAAVLARYGLHETYLSCCEDKVQGVILLGGTDCFSILNLSKAAPAPGRLPIRITDIEVDGKRWVEAHDIMATSTIFRHTDHVLQIHFSDFDYSAQRPNEYAYRLGGQSEWIPIKTSSLPLLLSSLNAGTYQLYIKHANDPQEDSGIQPVFTFTIQAPWYATTVAKIVYLSLVLGLLYGVYRFFEQRKRLKREREQRTELLHQAKEKEKELVSDKEYLAGQLRLQLVEKSGNDCELSADEKFLLDITRIIEDNMENSELNVNTLSEKSGISTKQLYRRIKASTGMTTVAYIRDQRMKKAASLLSKGTFTVSEVMYMVGFSSPSYFTRCFLDEYGVPPSEYKV